MHSVFSASLRDVLFHRPDLHDYLAQQLGTGDRSMSSNADDRYMVFCRQHKLSDTQFADLAEVARSLSIDALLQRDDLVRQVAWYLALTSR